MDGGIHVSGTGLPFFVSNLLLRSITYDTRWICHANARRRCQLGERRASWPLLSIDDHVLRTSSCQNCQSENTQNILAEMHSTTARLSEQAVIEAFHTLATTALEQAQTEGLLDPSALQGDNADVTLLGPALILFFAALASRADEPSVTIPTNPPKTLNVDVSPALAIHCSSSSPPHRPAHRPSKAFFKYLSITFLCCNTLLIEVLPVLGTNRAFNPTTRQSPKV